LLVYKIAFRVIARKKNYIKNLNKTHEYKFAILDMIFDHVSEIKIACYISDWKRMVVYCKLRNLGPNSTRNFYQTLARTRPVKTGPTYNSYAWMQP